MVVFICFIICFIFIPLYHYNMINQDFVSESITDHTFALFSSTTHAFNALCLPYIFVVLTPIMDYNIM